MNKTSIKVIKRKDAEVSANALTEDKTEQIAPVKPEEIERRSRRQIVNTVSNWISECRENHLTNETAATRRIFPGESGLSKI